MERHIAVDCSVMTGKSRKAKAAPVCARGKCGKVLFVPITCNVSITACIQVKCVHASQKCKQQFCPEHRFPNTHVCSPLPASSGHTSSKASAAQTQGFANVASHTSAARNYAMAAIKRSVASAASSSQVASSTVAATSTTSSSQPDLSPLMKPFSKTDR